MVAGGARDARVAELDHDVDQPEHVDQLLLRPRDVPRVPRDDRPPLPLRTQANSINKDLMVLGHCLRDLRWNQMHPKSTQRMPPFRDSRITMLFREYLSGGCVNDGPSSLATPWAEPARSSLLPAWPTSLSEAAAVH